MRNFSLSFEATRTIVETLVSEEFLRFLSLPLLATKNNKNKWINKSYRGVLDGDELVADEDAAVSVGRAALHDLGDVDAIVAGNVLVADPAGDAEPEPPRALDQVHLDDLEVRPARYPSLHQLQPKENQGK